MTRFALIPTLLMTSCLLAAPAWGKTLEPERSIEATADFDGKKPGRTATDVSGLACMPLVAGKRRCLLINDENRSAQFALLGDGYIDPAEILPLLGEAPSPATLGKAPEAACRRPGAFADLDGEAVAFADGAFYVSGSHGCSRRKGEFRLSAFHLARVKVDAAGKPVGPVEMTYRLSDMLKQAGEAAPFFGQGLIVENGLNVEGIAVIGDTLWAGLRAPSIEGRAFIVGASVAALFAPGREPARTAPKVVSFPVGPRRGIRDLAPLADGKLLALVGPAQDQDVPFTLMLLDPAWPDSARTLGTLRPMKSGKAEAVTVLDETPDSLGILIGYDGRPNGKLEEYRVPLR